MGYYIDKSQKKEYSIPKGGKNMPKHARQKTRILLLADLLHRRTDENHSITVDEMRTYLAQNGIDAERKSSYDDLSALSDYGLDIEKSRGMGGGYRLLSSKWQLSEIKTLIDAVQSNRFLTENKSRVLIDKLKTLTSDYNALALSRHVHIHNRAKSDNENVLYSLDALHEAIRNGKMVGFYYLDYQPDGTKIRRHGGRRYTVCPVELTIDDERYYLVAYGDRGDTLRHYRVDKMEQVTVLENCPAPAATHAPEDFARYSLATFGMFGGKSETVRLRAENRMASVLIDRFDRENCTLIPDGKDHFTLAVRVVISPQFFGWLFGLEGKVTILSPESAAKAYEDMLKNALYRLQNAQK